MRSTAEPRSIGAPQQKGAAKEPRAAAPIARQLPRAVLVAAVLGTALAYMSDDMLNLAIPSVARDLRATLSDVQWILNSYYVALVSFVLIAGAIGDVLGHRRVFTAGLVLFSLGGLVCAAASSVPVLVSGRGIQGVGAAMLLASGLALVTRLAPADRRGPAVGAFLGLVAAVPAVGPFLSGALVDLLSWRWLFVVPLMLPLAALGVTWLSVPETPRAPGRRIDLPGAAAMLVALGALSTALIVGPAAPLGATTMVAAALAVGAGIAFVLIERRAPDPMLPLRLLRRRTFLGGNLVWLLGSMTCWGAVFLLAITLQTTLGLRPIVAGTVLLPIYLVMMVGSPMAARLAERVGQRTLILAGLAIYIVGLSLLSMIGPGSSLIPDVMLALGVFAGGMAAFTAPLAGMTMSSLDDGDQGIAAGMNNAMANLAGLLAVVILPAAAGLAGVTLGGPEFAAGYPIALRVAGLLAGAGLLIAAVTLRTGAIEPGPTEGPAGIERAGRSATC